MEIILKKIKPPENFHEFEVSQQTGFPSAATHYAEPPIHLHCELVIHQDATFFVRVMGNSFKEFNIADKDVLIVDRSLPAKIHKLALVVENGEFQVARISNQLGEDTILWGIITYIIHRVL